MNAFNLSNQGLSFLWQEMRDAAKWEYESAENAEDRKAKVAIAALGNEQSATADRYLNIKKLAELAITLL